MWILLLGMLGLTGWILYGAWKETERTKRVTAEVDSLQSEADKIKSENETLSQKILYFSTDAYREEEAKDKLGYRKTDEAVAVIQPSPTQVSDGKGTGASVDPGWKVEADARPNYLKWWGLFAGE